MGFIVSEELVRRQLENEELVIDRGVQKYREALEEARQNGQMADTLPGRWLSANYLEDISREIRGFISESIEKKSGPCAAGVAMLTQMEPDVYAYIALRTIMNSVLDSKGECDKPVVQSRIVRELREEMQHSFMQAERSWTYKYWMREMQRAPEHRTKVRIMNRLKRNFPGLPSFRSDDEKFALSAAADFLIRTACRVSGVATIEQGYTKAGGKLKKRHYLAINPEFLVKLDKANDRAEVLWPKFEPMLCSPRPWTGAFGGGFVGKLGKRTKLVRTGNRAYLEDIHNTILSGGMGTVLTALNAIQSTPWRINRRILDVMRAAFGGAFGRAYRLPASEKAPLPPVPPDIKSNKQAKKDYADLVKAAQRLEAKRESKYRATRYMLDTAEKFRDEDAIYFAHNLDWRGRIYPMSSYLSPQGEELARALLEFSRGLPLETDEAVEWLAIHGAGCYGYDKVTFEERVQWVHDHERDIRESAGDPLNCTWWAGKEVDKPWMFLAWCFDWVGYLEDGKDHVSRIPVAMDGSCNGLQNFAAMLRHEETARAVNLAPSEKPADIYQKVADILTPRIKALAESETWTTEENLPILEERNRLEYADRDQTEKAKDDIRKALKKGTMTEAEARKARKAVVPAVGPEERKKTAHMWDVVAARWIWDKINRKLVKRPVMTYPYSVTLFGIRDQLVEVLLDMHGDGLTDYPIKHVGKVAHMLRDHVYAAIQETVVAAAKAMKWLREAAEVVAEGNLPVTWVSPVGMKVLQDYRVSTKKHVEIRVGGIKYKTSVYAEKEKEVKKSKQASGVAPNFVHSCDASHLMLTVDACLKAGIADFHMIHDSYGTHARNAAGLARMLREQFVNIYSERNVLQDFFEQLKGQLAEKSELATQLPPSPTPESFDLTRVLESRFFFA